MQIDPRDDFRGFGVPGDDLYGLSEPFLDIRLGLERELQDQIPGTVLDRIEVIGAPKLVTMETEERTPRIVHVAICFRAVLTATLPADRGRQQMAVTATFLYGRIDQPAHAVRRTHVDFHADAAAAFDDERLAQRFQAFSDAL